MSLPVYYARKKPGQLKIRNRNFEHRPIISGGSRAIGTWIVNTAAGSPTNDVYGWYFQTTGAGITYFDASTSKWGGSALFLASGGTSAGAPDATTNPSFSNWNGTNIQSYGIPCKANVALQGISIYKTSYYAGTITPTIGAQAFFEERDINGTLLATHQTDFVTGNTSYDPRTVSFTTTSTTAYLTVGGQIIGVNGINDLKMGAWFSLIDVIGTSSGRRAATSRRTGATNRRVVGG